MARHEPPPLSPRALLAPPLEERWRDLVCDVARARRWPTAVEPTKLGPKVAELSAAYNEDGRLDGGSALLPARLGFSFARDVPKSSAAVAELLLAGLLRFAPDRPLDVLDLGAGLGATTWGVVRALAAHGQRGVVRATLHDSDEAALAVASALAKAAGGEGAVRLDVRTEARPVSEPPRGRFDLVLLGQVLSELDRDLPADERAERHAGLIAGLVGSHVFRAGSLVVIEPALRERTRHLMAVRDRLVARGLTPFAPCLRAGACPMLPRETDWCHEDLAIDLPEWLVPTARAAGLRFEGLTFSYLVVRPDGASLASWAPAGALRVVSSVRVTKGKREASLCGDVAGSGALAAGLVRATLLDRDAKSEGLAAFGQAVRGDLMTVEPPLVTEVPVGGSAVARMGREVVTAVVAVAAGSGGTGAGAGSGAGAASASGAASGSASGSGSGAASGSGDGGAA